MADKCYGRPVFINFLYNPNPNSGVAIKLNDLNEIVSVRIHSVTHYKASTILITVLAIMAVDYPLLFDRWLCKSEDHGWALMDVGVSAVMFSSGFANKLIVKHKTAKKANFWKELMGSVTGNLGITIAATIRFFLLTGIDYHDHVTEWGVHWNFFLTIAVLNLFIVFVRSSRYTMLYGFSLLVLAELASLNWDLKTYVWYAPRTDMISANKEGVLSLAGYFAIQLIGIGIGSDIYETLIFKEPAEYLKYVKTKVGIFHNHD